MIKFDTIKGGDLPIPQVGEFGMEMPPFFASYSKSKGWKLLNPITTVRNLAKRKHNLVIDLKRGDVRSPTIVSAEPMDSPSFSQFKPADQAKLLAWERDVNANKGKSATKKYPHGPIKERGRPVYLGKNGEEHGYEYDKNLPEVYGNNPPPPPKPEKPPPKPRGRPKGPPKPPPPPKGPRGRPKGSKKVKPVKPLTRRKLIIEEDEPLLEESRPPEDVKALTTVPHLKSVERPKEDPLLERYKSLLDKMKNDEFKSWNEFRGVYNGLNKLEERNVSPYHSVWKKIKNRLAGMKEKFGVKGEGFSSGSDSDSDSDSGKGLKSTRKIVKNADKFDSLADIEQHMKPDKYESESDVETHMKRRKEPDYENSSTDGNDTDSLDDGGSSDTDSDSENYAGLGLNRPNIKGGALSADELKKLLGASYDAKTTKVNDFVLDPSVSSKTTKVYHNSKTGQTVVAHMGTQGITDWGNNAVYALGGKWAYKKTDRYKEAKKVQDAAEKKYGAKSISTIGHSQGGLQAELLGKNSKETITVNKATVPFQNKTNANQTDIRTQGDVVSALNPFQKKNKKEIEVKSSSYNPLTNHGTDTLSALDKDQMIGEGVIDFEDMKWGSFTEQFDRFRHDHPDVNVHSLKDFAEKILADPEHYKETTLRRAQFYLNVILKNKNHKSIYRMAHVIPHARGFGIDPRLMSPNPMFSRHPNAMANVFHSPHAMVSGLHGSGLSLQDVPGYGALRRLGDDVAHAGRHAEMVAVKMVRGKGAPIGPGGMKPRGMGMDMSGVRPIGPGSTKPRGMGLVKGSAEAKAFMASIRKKKMKGGAVPPPSRSPITDPSLL